MTSDDSHGGSRHPRTTSSDRPSTSRTRSSSSDAEQHATRSRAVRVAGVLACISEDPNKPELELMLPTGERVGGRLEPRAARSELRQLLDQPVVLSGVARFRASGQFLDVLVEDIGRASARDSIWATVPTVSLAAEPVMTEREGHSGVAAFFGTWPGDETDEQLLAALEALG